MLGLSSLQVANHSSQNSPSVSDVYLAKEMVDETQHLKRLSPTEYTEKKQEPSF
jgi:hypothetical protein